jgi:hypothetical protein
MLNELLEQLYTEESMGLEMRKVAADLDEMSDEELLEIHDAMAEVEAMEKTASAPVEAPPVEADPQEITGLQRDIHKADLWGRQIAHRRVVETLTEDGREEDIDKLSSDLGFDLVKSAEEAGFDKEALAGVKQLAGLAGVGLLGGAAGMGGVKGYREIEKLREAVRSGQTPPRPGQTGQGRTSSSEQLYKEVFGPGAKYPGRTKQAGFLLPASGSGGAAKKVSDLWLAARRSGKLYGSWRGGPTMPNRGALATAAKKRILDRGAARKASRARFSGSKGVSPPKP